MYTEGEFRYFSDTLGTSEFAEEVRVLIGFNEFDYMPGEYVIVSVVLHKSDRLVLQHCIPEEELLIIDRIAEYYIDQHIGRIRSIWD